MKKHNFLHRGIGWVERELEATLAILILLAAVVGYTLAGTEAVTPALTAQEAVVASNSLMVGSQGYSTLAFDRTISNAYQVRKLSITPSDVATVSGKGLVGTSAVNYTATVSLSEPFSGALYVWGKPSGASLNGIDITSETKPVVVTNADSLILTFRGITNEIRAISTNLPSVNTISATEISTLSLVPATATTTVGSKRSFIAIATNASGAAISADKLTLKWSVVTSPTGIAAVDGNGLVTTTGAGTVTVKVTAGSKTTASATITVVKTPEASTPATSATTTNQTSSTTTSANQTATKITAENAQSLMNKVTEILAGPANAAAPAASSAATGTVITPKVAVKALFDPATVATRAASTKSINPTKSEIQLLTQNMTLAQKITTNISVGFTQVIRDLKTIVVGTRIKDSAGTVIVNQPSAIRSIGNFIVGLFTSGTSASTSETTSIDFGEDDLN